MSTQPEAVTALDPLEVSPDVYSVLFENERVRLLDVRLKPGGVSPLHSHPAFIAYNLTDARVRVTLANGETKEVDLKAGEADWNEGETHAAENIGETECHVLNFELKS